MLVLSRKAGEEVVIRHMGTGQEILVGLVRIVNGKARLYFQADQEWKIMRREIDGAAGSGQPTAGSE